MPLNLESEHAFAPPSADASRSPCPGLNALANHGYIQRTGKNIGVRELAKALSGVYNLSAPLIAVLLSSGVFVAGSLSAIDLAKLAFHGPIEHDASLVHADANGAKYAPTNVDHKLLQDILAAHPNGFGLGEFAEERVKREAGLQNELNLLHKNAAQVESVLTWLLMNKDGVVPAETLRQFWGEERLPDTFDIPKDVIGLIHVEKLAGEVAGKMKQIREGKA